MLRRRLILAPLLAILLALPAPAWSITGGQLRSTMTSQMRRAGSTSSAYVIALNGDRRLYALRADRPLIPASINKLFVTATALLRYGPAQRLQTTVLTDGGIDANGVLRGSLYLRGAGDPTLSSARIVALADQLALTRVTGSVIGDGSRFDALPGSASTGGRLDSELGGQLGGLVADRGYARRGWQKRPAAVAAEALRAALQKRNVPVAGRSRVGTTPDGAVELARTSSVPMSQLVALTNTPSDNYYAETLLKDIGASFGGTGSTDAGAQVVEDQMAQIGVRPTIVDGSGLSRADRTSTRQIVTLLASMAGGDDGDAFVSSLSIAGRTGTLAHRLRRTPAEGNCRGKTGTLDNVSNVAGICGTRAGAVAFAILMNGVDPLRAHGLQDRMVSAIARLS